MFYKFIFVITRPGSSRQFFRVWKGTVLLLSGQMCGFKEFNVLMTQDLISRLIFTFFPLYFTGFWSINLKPALTSSAFACKNSLLMPPISASQLSTIFSTGACSLLDDALKNNLFGLLRTFKYNLQKLLKLCILCGM